MMTKDGILGSSMDQQKKETEHHGGAMNAFVLGVVVGVALTLLLTTKKGRRILRMFTDQGMDKIGKLEEAVVQKKASVVPNITEDIDEMMEGQDYIAAEDMKKEPTPSHVSEAAVKHALKHTEEHKNGVEKPSSGPRRMFKGAKKS
jgi:hypothetical protein